MRRLAEWTGAVAIVLAIVLASLWGGLALWFDGPHAVLAAVFAGGGLLLPVIVRPPRRALLLFAPVFAALLLWWLSIPPSSERDWQPDVANEASVAIDGSRVTIRNVRDFTYVNDVPSEQRWVTRTYDLDDLVGVDMFLSYWGPRAVAHTIASWEFNDGRHLAISIETRKEVGETYSAVKGFFRQYEIYYVVAEERDLVGVRARQRGENVFLYRLNTPVHDARKVLLDYLAEADRLDRSPRWYNALLHNCTTTIRMHAQQAGETAPWDWRILANGFIDEMGYERGSVTNDVPFEELRKRSEITAAAKASPLDESFSRRIRENLPGTARSH